MVTLEIQSINGTLVGQTGEEPGDGWDELVEDLADTEAQVVGSASGKTVNAIGHYISHIVTICCLYHT